MTIIYGSTPVIRTSELFALAFQGPYVTGTIFEDIIGPLEKELV